jgi:glycosyltransferase involved in cell wall biosynthesis
LFKLIEGVRIDSSLTDKDSISISIITVVYNSHLHIRETIESVLSQGCSAIEYLVIDGGSTDGTTNIILEYSDQISVFVSEPDNGIYDAMNKGVGLSSGDYVAFLNAGDYYTDRNLSLIADALSSDYPDLLYGDLDYIDDKHIVKRKWRSGAFSKRKLKQLWIPPHPTVFIKRELFFQVGSFDLQYKIASDYDLLLKALLTSQKVQYFEKVLVKMRLGGTSNKSIINIFKQNMEIFRSFRLALQSLPLIPFVRKAANRFLQRMRAIFSC